MNSTLQRTLGCLAAAYLITTASCAPVQKNLQVTDSSKEFVFRPSPYDLVDIICSANQPVGMMTRHNDYGSIDHLFLDWDQDGKIDGVLLMRSMPYQDLSKDTDPLLVDIPRYDIYLLTKGPLFDDLVKTMQPPEKIQLTPAKRVYK
ncbi:MAG: hypothetical protein V1743_07235 [Nanoarchaeota archaeon]